MRKKLTRIAAWLVTAALLVWLFKDIPFGKVLAATRSAAWWTIPVGFLGVAGIYLADSFAIWKTFGWFLAPLSFLTVLVLRGGTYLLAAINYSVGQAGIAYFVRRAAGKPLMRGIATILLIMGINVLALLFMTTAGELLAPDVPRTNVIFTVVAYGGLVVYAVALTVRPRWLASRPIFDVLLDAGWSGHVKALLVRLPHIAALIVFQMSMLRAFDVRVPLAQAIVALPVVFIVGVLPIAVQGLGTTQAAMIYFFARYAPGDATAQKAAVLAASLFAVAVATSFQAVLGLLCLRSRTGRELRTATSAATQTTPDAAPIASGGDGLCPSEPIAGGAGPSQGPADKIS
jgi:hypothetical protein